MYEGELLLSDMDPAARGWVPGEWPDGLTEGSELGSVSVSCCEAVAVRKAEPKIRKWTLQLFAELVDETNVRTP